MRGTRTGGVTALACAALAVLLVLGALGCGGSGGGDPKVVAQDFLNALIAHDASGSYTLLSMKFKGEWGITPMSWNGVMMRNRVPEAATYTINGQDTQGDSATVTITPDGGADEQVKLVSEDGKWLIDYELNQWYGLAPGGW